MGSVCARSRSAFVTGFLNASASAEACTGLSFNAQYSGGVLALDGVPVYMIDSDSLLDLNFSAMTSWNPGNTAYVWVKGTYAAWGPVGITPDSLKAGFISTAIHESQHVNWLFNYGASGADPAVLTCHAGLASESGDGGLHCDEAYASAKEVANLQALLAELMAATPPRRATHRRAAGNAPSGPNAVRGFCAGLYYRNPYLWGITHAR